MLTQEQSQVIQRIVSLIERNGMTAKTFAERIGVGSTTVSEWKKGRTHPSVDHVRSIARLFGVSTDFIINGEEFADSVKKEHKIDSISANTMYKAFELLSTEHKQVVTEFIIECIRQLGQSGAGTSETFVTQTAPTDDEKDDDELLKEFEAMKSSSGFGSFDLD